MNNTSVSEDEKSTENPKFTHPHILLIDTNQAVLEELTKAGYNAQQGSLGTPYAVEQSGGYSPLVKSTELPHGYREHDLLIVDTEYEEVIDDIEIPTPALGVDMWWVQSNQGYVNPRSISGWALQKDFDRIVADGGLCIIFASRRSTDHFAFGQKNYRGLSLGDKIEISNYSFVSSIDFLSFQNKEGSRTRISDNLDKDTSLIRLISQHVEDAQYSCTISCPSHKESRWVCLVENKYGECVGGVIPPLSEGAGWTFIFPRFQDQAGFVSSLVSEVLPDFAPNLFPESSTGNWVHRDEYELPKVKTLQQKVAQARQRCEQEINQLNEEISSVESAYAYLFDLIRETGTPLVHAVMKALEVLGFNQVVDVDALIDEAVDGPSTYDEDLRIEDRTPTLICEVKGVGGFPADEDALAVQKYVVRRMKEWERTDVKGITIINHQRHLPPLDRENVLPFRNELLVAAEEQEIGLLTTWDLHRLTRSKLQNEWPPDTVISLLYKSGRIEPVPAHYEYVGTIQAFIEDIGVVGVEVTDACIRKGDRIAFELPVVFMEQECDSLEVDNKPVESTEVGNVAGIKTDLMKDEAKKGTRVYRVVTDKSVPSQQAEAND